MLSCLPARRGCRRAGPGYRRDGTGREIVAQQHESHGSAESGEPDDQPVRCAVQRPAERVVARRAAPRRPPRAAAAASSDG